MRILILSCQESSQTDRHRNLDFKKISNHRKLVKDAQDMSANLTVEVLQVCRRM